MIKISAFSLLLIWLFFGEFTIQAQPKQSPELLKSHFPYELGPLGFAYDALEPHFDKMTMEIHYFRHHNAYVQNLNKALSGTEFENWNLEAVFAKMSQFPAAVRNNGGGHYNHWLFWKLLLPGGPAGPEGDLLVAINRDFGTLDNFKNQFSEAAKSRFGSGWAWLSVDATGKLFISSTPNQDNPLMDLTEKKGVPILALDVWEHAYYLKFQNRRPDYIQSFWNVLNWNVVKDRYALALSK